MARPAPRRVHFLYLVALTFATVLPSRGQFLPKDSENPFWCAPSEAPVPATGAPKQPESTLKMAALLRQIAAEADPMKNTARNNEQAAMLTQFDGFARNVHERLIIKKQLATHLMQAGFPEKTLEQNKAIRALMAENNLLLRGPEADELLMNDAMAYMRLGEQENCLLDHNSDSCLLPIKDGGVHRLKRGSRGAIKCLSELLTHSPGDLRALWVLNIAYMTVGEYPDKVPKQWLINPDLFKSDYDIKRFPDVAGELGLDVNDFAGGVIMDDFDNDGLLDVACSAWGLNSQLRIFRNNGDGTFSDRTLQSGVLGIMGGLNCIQTDYNNDGWIDLFVLRGGWLRTEGHYPPSLLRNNGDFTFTDVTEETGLLAHYPTQTCVWFDYNGDGWLDLYMPYETTGRDFNPNRLYRNNRNGTFTECAASCGLDLLGFFKGAVSSDYNHDGRPDLFLSRRDGSKMLWRNDGPADPAQGLDSVWKFTEVATEVGITDPPMSFPCWFFDYDNDGFDDLMISGYSIQDSGDIAADYMGRPSAGHTARLYHNKGDGTFEDVSKAMHVNRVLHAMGCNFGDLDNDGWLDFYVGTGDPDLTTLIPNRMFRNNGGQYFQDVTTSGGFGQIQKGHGIAFGDIDNDGDQDIYSVVGGAVEADHYHNQLFANPGHGNHWLKLKLEGVKSNRAAIGARVRTLVRTPNGTRSLYRTVGSGGSFGASPYRLEIGLGKAEAVERVEIFWPVTGKTQVVTGLQMDRAYQIREDESSAHEQTLVSFSLPNGSNPKPHTSHAGLSPR